ncbi:ribose 5-phosphate isomerase B [Alicyclobacillus fastidiosus]|uniref:Ribose 5-phosphate isomerase B n=1 Tax=Alicyclobacillus fastidiosus TaxID=392011 RepID=A0ABV5A946_9BACL|nr:ribose 5-phosphate isomerase B [Alicyclobacillus fastidiosus]WEH10747.1 ribose 5-phosphate isomerase B [Alicyclobacillus fastidiosus]
MKVSLGNDHAGFRMRPDVKEILSGLGCETIDFGSTSEDPVDFPDIAQAVCNAVKTKQATRGIMVCGTGVGAVIAANKIAGIRAALCHDVHSAHQSVEHDDVNVLCLGAQIIGPWLAKDIIEAFIHAQFRDEEPFRGRVAKIRNLERVMAREVIDEC